MLMRRLRFFALLVVTAAAAGACTPPAEGPRPSRSAEVITSAEIDQHRALSALDIVQRLRPGWLRVRAQRSFNTPTEILVYNGQMRLGGVDALSQIRGTELVSIRWLDPSVAITQLPGISQSRPSGVIQVELIVGRGD